MSVRNTLRLQRFCGREVYEVKAADVFLDLPKADEEGILLNLKFDAGSLIECTTPDNERGDAPSVEVNLPIPSVAGDELVGKTIRVKRSSNEERGTWNRIYVFEHEDLRDIAATFVEVTENECRLSLTGRTQDPNHYDGSKAETIVKLESWFPLAELKQVARALAEKAVPAEPVAEEAPLPQANFPSKNPDDTAVAQKPAPTQAASKKPPPKKPRPTQAASKKPLPKKPAPTRAASKKPARAPKKAPPKKAPPKKALPKKALPKKALPKKRARAPKRAALRGAVRQRTPATKRSRKA